MRILHIITAFGFGGAENLLLTVLNIQVKKHQVFLIYLKPIDDLLIQIDKNVNVQHIPITMGIVGHLKKQYKIIKPDIIHTHLGHADFLGLWSARKFNAKLICTLHNVSIRKNTFDRLIYALYKLLFKQLSSKLFVISISKTVEKHVLDTLMVSKSKSYLLRNAIGLGSAINLDQYLVKSEKKVLLFVGRLEKQKSVETLIEAMAILKSKGYENKIELLLVGEGSLRSSLARLTHKLGLDSMIKFEGSTPHVDGYYKRADLFILPSIWEGFGIVILEAFRASVPVISSNVEGPAEIISDNNNGLLFESKNFIDLSQKIISLLNDDQKRTRIGKNGYLSFTSEFHIEGYVKSLNTLYQNVLNE